MDTINEIQYPDKDIKIFSYFIATTEVKQH